MTTERDAKCRSCNWYPAGKRGLCPRCEAKTEKLEPCVLCGNAEEIPWGIGEKKTALRCLAPGPHQGHVAAIFERKTPRAPYIEPPPPWCPGFEFYNK